MDFARQSAEARLVAAAHAREVADFARGIVGDVSSSATAADRIRAARRLRLLSLQVLNWTVRAEVLSGESWADLASALGRDEDAVREEFGAGTVQWAERNDADPNRADLSEAEAQALDDWYAAHAEEVLDPGHVAPVSALFTTPRETP
ncbi:hypothetical protein ACFWRZ_09260 [Streptomyces rubiginosohelvolus]|uniref:hypothetical protein n=1 Tax=Streptomyces rubiginosohelvolus TaxID=67362 RepID=UPI003654D021